MEPIKMVDLHKQYLKIKDEIHGAFDRILQDTAFINGPPVKAFARALSEYLDIPHVIPCGNGTDALQIALMALDLRPGDEVITVDFTFAATVEVIGLLGLTPVLVDISPATFTMDIDALRNAITPRTKAIVPVHLFGQSAGMDEIMRIAREHGLYVVEDTAQALGADYTFPGGETKKAGTIGHIGTTSFFPSKNLGAYGDGGALFTADDKLAERIRSIANHGMSERYYYERLGVNSRLDSLQAAVLLAKLPHLDAYARARQQAADYYDRAFREVEGIEIPGRNPRSTHVFHQYTLKFPAGVRDGLKKFLHENGIPSAIYYPVPLHKQKAYAHFRFEPENLTVSTELSKKVLSLPMHTELTGEQLEYITRKVVEYVNRHK